MAFCWFSLTPGRTEPIEHAFVDARSKRAETIRITGMPEHGIATIHDQDLLIFVISQWIEAKRLGLEPSRRVSFTPYQFFAFINIAPQGSAYQRLKESLHRLRSTNIETTIRSPLNRRNRIKQFSWINEWEVKEENGQIRGVEVVLPEWLFDSIQNFHVLTLDRGYFDIRGPVARWLYLYARKATGGATGHWSESFRSLHKKSASQQAFKHYANALRKIVKKNDFPGLRLEKRRSAKKQDMLFMERTVKSVVPNRRNEQQLCLIEQTPLEEAWENALDTLRRHLGAPTVTAWLLPLRLISFEDGTLLYRAPTKFIADHVQSLHTHRLKATWQALGYEVNSIQFEIKKAARSNAKLSA